MKLAPKIAPIYKTSLNAFKRFVEQIREKKQNNLNFPSFFVLWIQTWKFQGISSEVVYKEIRDPFPTNSLTPLDSSQPLKDESRRYISWRLLVGFFGCIGVRCCFRLFVRAFILLMIFGRWRWWTGLPCWVWCIVSMCERRLVIGLCLLNVCMVVVLVSCLFYGLDVIIYFSMKRETL